MKKIFLIPLFFLFLAFPALAEREVVTEWYVKDFQAEFVLNEDSSITVTERITADCGNLSGKHGIFRILPKYANTPEGKIKYPIKLLSITDENGRARKYSVQEGNATMTWKIGDPDIEVLGENYYEIKYLVKNTVRQQDGFDEFYWNLSGNYWDMEIDNFEAEVVFPEGIDRDNVETSLYSGMVGDTNSESADYEWKDKNILRIFSINYFLKGEGVTLSASFPQGIVIPYKPSLMDYLAGEHLWLILPAAVFLICFLIWKKYGDDPAVNKPVVAEYQAPGGLAPIEMNMLVSEGSLNNRAVTAAIIRMAVLGVLKINETKNKAFLITYKEFELEKLEGADISRLSEAEKAVYDVLFIGRQKIKLSKLVNNFYKSLPIIKERAKEFLLVSGYMDTFSPRIKGAMITGGAIFLIIGFFVIGLTAFFASASFIISGLIVIFFSLVMTRKTAAGAALAHQIKGFKDYIKTAEKYRARFYEEKNIFEAVLPYAIMFNLTGIWIKKMKEIYGEDYFQTHIPAWYAGSSLADFSADSFSSLENSISSSISSSTSSSSGHGGGGFSGGGGGGGGGGGW